MRPPSSSHRTRRHLCLALGAFVLPQAPAAPFLVLYGVPGGLGLAAYLLGSLAAFLGVFAVGHAWLGKIDRIVGLVRGYEEDGSLSPADSERPGCEIEQVKSALTELDQAARRLEADAARDPLTGILNRRTCAARLEGDLARSRRGDVAFSVAIFDLDDLKAINDAHGHAAGDAALRRLAQVLQGFVREGDWVARWGGDEFLLGLWGADAEAAATVARRILAQLAAEPVVVGECDVVLGASVGVGQAHADDDATRLFSRVDAALFQAKRGGRGRVSLS